MLFVKNIPFHFLFLSLFLAFETLNFEALLAFFLSLPLLTFGAFHSSPISIGSLHSMFAALLWNSRSFR